LLDIVEYLVSFEISSVSGINRDGEISFDRFTFRGVSFCSSEEMTFGEFLEALEKYVKVKISQKIFDLLTFANTDNGAKVFRCVIDLLEGRLNQSELSRELSQIEELSCNLR